MYTGYNDVSTPVLRNPRLFHQNTGLSTSAYYTTQQPAAARSAAHLYTPYTSPYTPYSYSKSQSQSRFPVQAPAPSYPHSYPYYTTPPRPMIYSPMPYPSYSVPTNTYMPTIPSNGLALILIATLVLVALDLMIVRPLKYNN